jgi:hypothetical protein
MGLACDINTLRPKVCNHQRPITVWNSWEQYDTNTLLHEIRKHQSQAAWQLSSMCWKVLGQPFPVLPRPIIMWLHVFSPLIYVLKCHSFGLDEDIKAAVVQWLEFFVSVVFCISAHWIELNWIEMKWNELSSCYWFFCFLVFLTLNKWWTLILRLQTVTLCVLCVMCLVQLSFAENLQYAFLLLFRDFFF